MIQPSLKDNITKLTQRVRLTVEMCGRTQDRITLLAVSKTRPASELRAAFEYGIDQFGENYLSEALEKMADLQDLPLTWHFIGPIQSNKTRAIAGHFAWVQSVDREKIARRLAEQRPADLPPLNVCIQVNISAEASKSGASPRDLPALAQCISELPALRLRGLMAIPARSDDPAQRRAVFAELHSLYRELRAVHPSVDTLSMGMSGDFAEAIAEGATLLRIGSALFGPRNG
ncbi:YggS family pyridoxal phosphate-dependent enzyme [Haliea sp. E17]|uniref:YggS family pyridoxal phosphate-dependent enzyme n=1 Tax=Haliea sp. E17 TaxID=3401576 RepID=UPI003AAF09CE